MSFAETMVSLAIIFVLFGSLVPLMHTMHASLQLKKERVAAYETLYDAAVLHQRSAASSGSRMAEGIRFNWRMTDQLCVEYDNYRGEAEKLCIR